MVRIKAVLTSSGSGSVGSPVRKWAEALIITIP
jgi:hypothetical protein